MKTGKRTWRGTWTGLLFLALLCWVLPAQAIDTDPRSGSQFYIDSFGLLAPAEFPLSARVQTVFDKLLRVADKAEYKDPGLLLIDSPDWPWAIALPDNNVVLSKGAVELCYRAVSQELGDARLAMILGHELGHLAEDDYWHRDVYLSLGGRDELEADNVMRFIGERSGLVNPDSDEWRNLVRDRELKADDRGFIYSALAGFNTRLLLGDEDDSFFHYWTRQTSVSQDKYHLTPAERAGYIKARSGALSEVAELFEFAVAMTHLGEYDAAEKVFRQILTQFPAHEVYNNLGYIRLQKGLERINVDADQVFWFPATLDTAPQTPEIMSRSVGTDFLDEATDFFQLAIKQNPGYLDGYLNLSTAFYYQGKFNSAAATLAEARTIASDNLEIEGLWQIAMLQSLRQSVDYAPIARSKLEELATAPAAPLSLLFNLAQLYEQAGDQASAVATWHRLANARQAIPFPYQDLVSLKIGRDGTQTAGGHQGLPQILRQQQKTVTGFNADKTFGIRLAGGNLQRSALQKGGLEYTSGGISHLRKSAIAQGFDAVELESCCGQPVVKRSSGLGEVWIYGNQWAALLKDGMVSQVWENLVAR